MIVTWTTLRTPLPAGTVPWQPHGASWWQAGHSGAGRLDAPLPDGRWWSVLATWDDRDRAAVGPARVDGLSAWHLVLEAASSSGDAVLAGGARPFDALPPAASIDGAAALLTFAGRTTSSTAEREFFRRFQHLARDLARAPGHVTGLFQAPDDGTVLTLSVWEDLRTALAWAYAQPGHAAAVARQRTHRLVDTSGSLRCAVLSSSGTLGDRPDPLDGRRGAVVRSEHAQH